MNITAPQYIMALLKPSGVKPVGRKVWSIDLETVWLPFFTATNSQGLTLIPHEAIGAPLRLAYNPDSTPKFNERTGKPVIRVAKELGESVRLVRENFVANLQQYVTTVRAKDAEGFNSEIKLNAEAGKPIIVKDREAIDKAIAEAVAQSMNKAEAKPQTEPVTA